MKNIKKPIGKRIRQIRVKLKLTQEQFAEKLHSSKSTISGYELGDTYPSVEVAILIAKIGEVSLDWLLAGHDADETNCVIDGLTPEENRLVQLFRNMSHLDQAAILRIAEKVAK